eukprot:2285404-Rhodomonas_salina.1
MDKRKRDHEYAEIARTKKLVYPKPYLCGLDGKGALGLDALWVALSRKGGREGDSARVVLWQ